jgi:HEPN domain-containing protein
MAETSQRKPIRMDLRENAYDFLNESLRAAENAEGRPHAWKFAILHAVQAIELLLKARLQAEHLP